MARPADERPLGRTGSGGRGGTEAEEALAFAEAYRMLWKCIGIFVNLPMASLDRMSLQRRLEEIGRAKA